MKTGRLIRIGMLFTLSLFILVWGINFLKGKKLLQREKIYYAEYQKIGGLTESSPVMINGLSVGKVREISLNDFRTGRIMVEFIVSYPDLEIPVGSLARIVSTDLMGTKAIEIVLSDSAAYYAYEDTLPGTIEGDLKDQVNNQMLPLKRSAEELMSSMDSVLVAIKLVFGPSNRENLAQSFESVTQTIQNLERTTVFLDRYVKEESEKFSYILSNTDTISSGLKNRSAELHRIITNISQISDTLGQIPLKDISENLNFVLSDIHQFFNDILSGEGNLGKLSQDDSLYVSLMETTENLNYLINDIRLNPKRYIHFSALNRGRTIISSNDTELLKAIKSESLEYFVCILKSVTQLDGNQDINKEFKNLSVIEIDNIFYYYINKTKNLDQAKRIISKNIDRYPNAGIYTWINGNWQEIIL